MTGYSKKNRENYPRECFWWKEKETQVSAKRHSDNWALVIISLFLITFPFILLYWCCKKKIVVDHFWDLRQMLNYAWSWTEGLSRKDLQKQLLTAKFQDCVHQKLKFTNLTLTAHFWEQGLAQWWEHCPPTNVARVRILASTPYMGWVCCWFSPLLRDVFRRALRFSPLLKNQDFQIPIRSETQGDVSTSCHELPSAPWVNKLQLHWICRINLLPWNWSYADWKLAEAAKRLQNPRTPRRKHWSSARISERLLDCTTSFLPENEIIVSKPCFSELETRSSRLETRNVIESRESNRDCQLRACLQGERVTLVLGLP